MGAVNYYVCDPFALVESRSPCANTVRPATELHVYVTATQELNE